MHASAVGLELLDVAGRPAGGHGERLGGRRATAICSSAVAGAGEDMVREAATSMRMRASWRSQSWAPVSSLTQSDAGTGTAGAFPVLSRTAASTRGKSRGQADRFPVLGHWQPIPGSQVCTGRDALVQSIELAVAAEELGLDGAYVRVHHFARQLASPFPLLAAMAARTSRIEIGTGVVDMRYETRCTWRRRRRPPI